MRFLREDAECAGPLGLGSSARFGCRPEADSKFGNVDSRTRGRPSMLPWSWVAESGYVRPSLVSLTPLSKPGALEARTVNVSNPTPDPIRPRADGRSQA